MRILIVDDDAAVHEHYARCLRAGTADDAPHAAQPDLAAAELTHCHEGLDAVEAVRSALAENRSFAMAFVEVRLRSGIDGRETARLIRALDPEINLVIVTADREVSPLEIARVAGPVDKLFYIVKPFEPGEIQQTATALAKRWADDRALAMARAQLRTQVLQLEELAAELATNESRAMHMAMHDSLTDAPNRAAFHRALSARVRDPGRFACAMLDLDRFKLVNDTLGHLAGDELIRAVYAILTRAAPEGAMIARLGGDEFGVLFDAPSEGDACRALDRLLAACSATMEVFGHSVQGGASAGLVVVEDTALDAIDVIRRADLALNQAKRAGKGVKRLFDESMDESIRFRRELEGGLGEALAKGEISLVYQPIVTQGVVEIVGFEALARWTTGEWGEISPAVFIPIAEETAVIHELGDWVLARALEQVKEWPGQYVSVNFSPRQFRRSNFVGHVVQAVQAAGVDPARLQIEITEDAIFDDAEEAASTLFKLRQMGFRIALDDYGTGYSSLYNIRKFALDCLKIDRSFIDGMGRERESAAIVHSIIHLGRSLGLGIIAEGVETEAQVQALRVAGASHLQGFFFAAPVSAAAARQMASLGAIGSGPSGATGTHG